MRFAFSRNHAVKAASSSVPDARAMTAWVASSSLALKSKLEFKEENANHKSRPLIAIDERMIADNASCVQSGEQGRRW